MAHRASEHAADTRARLLASGVAWRHRVSSLSHEPPYRVVEAVRRSLSDQLWAEQLAGLDDRARAARHAVRPAGIT